MASAVQPALIDGFGRRIDYVRELRDLLRHGGREAVEQALDTLVAGRPPRHDFHIGGAPAVERHMNVTGG